MVRGCVMALLALALVGSPVAAQTVDEVIAKNIEARGGLEKLKSVQSMRLTGKMMMGPGMEAPMMLEMRRPKSLRLEFTFQGMTGVQAFDGKEGWMIMPFGGKKEPEPMSPDDVKEAEEQADMDGPLVDHKAKGHTVELVGKEKLEGSDVYKLKVNLKNGNVRYDYIDAESFLSIKEEAKRTIRGSEVEVENTLGDYKEVGGLMIPHSLQSGVKGRPEKQSMIVEKVELNPGLDDARFKMPAAPKPEAKPEAPKGEAPAKPPKQD